MKRYLFDWNIDLIGIEDNLQSNIKEKENMVSWLHSGRSVQMFYFSKIAIRAATNDYFIVD